jgi:hypothetical protein
MKILTLIFCISLATIACSASDYYLIQSQVQDEVPMHGPVDKATIYVLLQPDRRVDVFRAFDSHQMEEIVKHFPRGSVLHYVGSGLIPEGPKSAEIDKLMAFCKSKGITLDLMPTN